MIFEQSKEELTTLRKSVLSLYQKLKAIEVSAEQFLERARGLSSGQESLEQSIESEANKLIHLDDSEWQVLKAEVKRLKESTNALVEKTESVKAAIEECNL